MMKLTSNPSENPSTTEVVETSTQIKTQPVVEYVGKLTKKYDSDSGYDLHSQEYVVINPEATVKIKTGVYLSIPVGYEAVIRPRSSTSLSGLNVPIGTIDEDYTGEICVAIQNISRSSKTIMIDDRIAQLVIQKKSDVIMKQVSDITKKTERGSGGFGHTGK